MSGFHHHQVGDKTFMSAKEIKARQIKKRAMQKAAAERAVDERNENFQIYNDKQPVSRDTNQYHRPQKRRRSLNTNIQRSISMPSNTGNNKKKNIVFQSNMYSFISYLPWERSGQGVIHQFATSNFPQSNLQI